MWVFYNSSKIFVKVCEWVLFSFDICIISSDVKVRVVVDFSLVCGNIEGIELRN